MKVRIKFAKEGVMKFIGHLDMMRYFQKAFRRAKIDIAYSQGFNPHQLISIATPLGVGLTSTGEYMDIVLNSATSSEELIEQINNVMAEGVRILNLVSLPDNSKNAMSIIAAADYELKFASSLKNVLGEEFAQKIASFYQQETINIVKKTKKSEKEVDIRPMIHEIKVIDEHHLFMQLATGSAANLKPELVLDALGQYLKVEEASLKMTVKRLELYADHPKDNGVFVPLDWFGKPIPKQGACPVE